MSDRVYLAATRAGRGVWHWTVDTPCSTGPRSACLSWPLNPDTARPPLAVDIADRCRGNGCRHRWDQWLRGLVKAALQAHAAQIGEPA